MDPGTVALTFPTSSFVPVVLGFFGLGTGYLIWGPQELWNYPPRDPAVDRSTGVWGIFMPGLCQLITGLYLFTGLTVLGVFHDKALYMAAVAFSAYGIHWFALGWNRIQGSDPRPNAGMAVAFTILSALGVVVFFGAGVWPVALLFIGLTAVYVTDFVANVPIGATAEHPNGRYRVLGTKAHGVAHLVTGVWLMYLTFATTLNLTLDASLPGG